MQTKTSVILLTFFGVLLLSVGIVFPIFFPSLFEKMLVKRLTLRPGGPTMEAFEKTPIPIFMQMYLFNVTNAEDVLNGEKPILQEVGPYTYYETRQKYDFHWNDEQGTLKYKQNKTFYFDQEKSGDLKESDLITTINPVLVSIASKVSKGNVFLQSILGILSLRFSMDAFITRRADELLFKGYEEPIISLLGKLSKKAAYDSGRFGFFHPRNNSNGGFYEIYTGAKGMDNYQFIASWQGKTELGFWKRDDCNMVNGTEGSQFPRPVQRGRNIEMFVAELCRSVYAVYEKDVDHGPVTLYRFILTRELLEVNDHNRCYCSDPFTCRSSMIDVGPCRDGAPIVISTPHFYQGDAVDLEGLEGLNPVKERHETYLDLEPNTGVVFNAAKRIQINIILKRYADFPSLKNVPELVLPVMWVSESAYVPFAKADKVNKSLTRPKLIVTYTCWCLVAIGCVLLLIAFIKALLACKNSSDKGAKRPHRGDDTIRTQEKAEIHNLLNKSNSAF